LEASNSGPLDSRSTAPKQSIQPISPNLSPRKSWKALHVVVTRLNSTYFPVAQGWLSNHGMFVLFSTLGGGDGLPWNVRLYLMQDVCHKISQIRSERRDNVVQTFRIEQKTNFNHLMHHCLTHSPLQAFFKQTSPG